MNNRLIVIQSYLFMLGAGLLAMGVFALVAFLQQAEPGQLNVLLLPDSALMVILTGLLWLLVLQGNSRWRWLPGLAVLLLCSYTLVHNYLAGGANEGVSLVSGFLRSRSQLALLIAMTALAVLAPLWPGRTLLLRLCAGVLGLSVLWHTLILWQGQAWGYGWIGFKFSADLMAVLVLVLLMLTLGLWALSYLPAASRLLLNPLTLVIGICAALAAALVWYALAQADNRMLAANSDLVLDATERQLDQTLRSRMALLQRMGERWEVLGQLPLEPVWRQESNGYLRDHADIQFIALLDADLQLLRLRQRDREDRRILQQLLQAHQGMDLWHRHASPEPGHSRAFLAGQSGSRSLLVMPLDLQEGRFLLVASLELGQTLEGVFGRGPELFALQVWRNQQPIIAPPELTDWLPVTSRELSLEHDEVWQLQTLITRYGFVDQNTRLSAAVFAFMLLLGLLLMISQRLAGLALERNRAQQLLTLELTRSLEQQMKLAVFNQQVMRQSMDMICTVDRDGCFVRVSESVSDILGVTPAELEGQRMLDFVLPEDAQRTADISQVLLAGQPTRNFRNRYRHRDGHAVPIMWSAVYDSESGQLLGVGRDISQLVVQETFAQQQLEVLGMISRQVPLGDILTRIAGMAEKRLPGCRASIHQLQQAQPGLAWAEPLYSAAGQLLGYFMLQCEQHGSLNAEQEDIRTTCARLAALAIERAQDRRELEESEQRYRSLFSFNPDAVFSLDCAGNFRSMNESGVTLTGIEADRLQQMNFRQVMHRDDLMAVEAAFMQAVAGQPQRYKARVIAADQQILELDISLLPIQVNGGVQGVFGIAKDLRAYKQARRALERQLGFTRGITNSLQEGLLATDAAGRIEFANPAALQLLEQAQLAAAVNLHDWTPLDTSCWIDTPDSGLTGEFMRQQRHIHYHATPLRRVDEESGWVIILRDITREIETMRALRERDEFFRLSQDMFCMISLKGDFVQLNPSFLQVLGYREQELQGQPYIELIKSADRHLAEAAINRLAQGEVVTNLDLRVRHADGHYLLLEIGAALDEDRIIYVVARDVTAQRDTQRLLEQHRSLFDIAGQIARVGGWVADLASGELLLSDEVCAIHRLPPGTCLPLDEVPRLYAPHWHAELTERLNACISDGTPYDVRCEALTEDGDLIWVRLMGKALYGSNGRITHVQGALQDVTAQVRAEQEVQQLAARLRNILESVTDAFFSLDRNWRFTYVNHQAEVILQRRRGELIGGDVWQLFPEATSGPLYERYQLAMGSGEVQHFEVFYPPLDCWLEVNAYPFDGGLSVFFRDIGERKAAEQRLQLTMRELERSNRELQDFAFIASHDLQEPLRKVQAFGERLQQRASSLDETGQDYLQRMRQAAERMQALVRDLLTYSRVTTQGEALQPVALDAVLDEVMQDLETVIEDSGAQIERQPLATVLGDRRQLHQLLQNLLSNALKFHLPEQPPQISISASQRSDGGWTLCVADQGIGFDEKYLDRIFNPFQRLHDRQQYAGTGIGLAVVCKIAQRHGAEVRASSRPGEGARFFIDFPAATGATGDSDNQPKE